MSTREELRANAVSAVEWQGDYGKRRIEYEKLFDAGYDAARANSGAPDSTRVAELEAALRAWVEFRGGLGGDYAWFRSQEAADLTAAALAGTAPAKPDARDVEIARLREALAWYADPNNHQSSAGFVHDGCDTPVNDDAGSLAFQALALTPSSAKPAGQSIAGIRIHSCPEAGETWALTTDDRCPRCGEPLTPRPSSAKAQGEE